MTGVMDAMKTLILITGPLAAYKSTLARTLARNHHVAAFTKDDFKEQLTEQLGAADRTVNLKLSVAAVRLLETAALSVLQSQNVVLVEANFKAEEIARFQAVCEAQDIQLVCVQMTGEPKTLYARYLKREATRHPAHRSAGTMSLEMFTASVNYYDTMPLPKPSFRYDTGTEATLLFTTIATALTPYLQ